MSDIGEAFAAIRAYRRERAAVNRFKASRQFAKAARIAELGNLELYRRCDTHYQIRCPEVGWLLNVYPGYRRLYRDGNHAKPPYLKLPHDWGLIDVVSAAVEQRHPEAKPADVEWEQLEGLWEGRQR